MFKWLDYLLLQFLVARVHVAIAENMAQLKCEVSPEEDPGQGAATIRLRVRGVEGRENELFFSRPANGRRAREIVVYFPGDVQASEPTLRPTWN